jgi:hypothetical protein
MIVIQNTAIEAATVNITLTKTSNLVLALIIVPVKVRRIAKGKPIKRPDINVFFSPPLISTGPRARNKLSNSQKNN